MTKTKARFIVFEGGEGSGKSTQIRFLQKVLQKKGCQVHLTLEPGGTPLGLELRRIVLDPKTGAIHARTEALLFAAARAEHAEQVIRPALARGEWVLCDRYIDASLAYQGIGRGLGFKGVRNLNEWATEGLYPDRVYLCDLSPSEGLRRAKERNAPDRLESEALSFHEKIREAYLSLAAAKPDCYLVLDGSKPIEELQKTIENDLEQNFF